MERLQPLRGGGGDRAPKSQAELEAKLDRIAEVLNGETPHRIALAEVQSLGLLERLHARLSGTFDVLWEDGPPEGATVGTGLAVLAGPTIFDEMSKVDVYRPTRWMRPRALNVELSVASALGRGGRFLLSCNHRKSRMRYGNVDPASDQNDTAEWLGDQLAGYDRTDCAVVVGDFNAEPWEPAFGDFKLRSRRTCSGALWSGSTPAYLIRRGASRPSRPTGTRFKAADASRNDVRAAVLVLRSAGKIHQGGERRFSRYAATARAAKQASLRARGKA